MKFVNKRVWITGASSGIGRALAIAFSKGGARCILTARNKSELEKTKLLCSNSNDHTIVQLDLTDPIQISNVVKDVLATGPIDILINNAGVSQRSEAIHTDMEVYRSLMELNYFGVVSLTKGVLPSMINKGSGMLVNISSIAGKVGPPFRTGYAASKHALHGFFDSLRSEVQNKGVHVLMVCPGYVNTAIAKNALAGDGKKYNKIDNDNANGLDPDELAVKILRAISSRKYEVAYGKFEKNAIYLKRFLPSVLRKLLLKKYNEDPK